MLAMVDIPSEAVAKTAVPVRERVAKTAVPVRERGATRGVPAREPMAAARPAAATVRLMVSPLEAPQRGTADDAAIVAALRAGDEATFARLVDEWSPAMLRLARAQVGSHAAAEEIVQEAWLAALRGLDRFEGRSLLRTWLFRIVLNIARTSAVRERRSIPFSEALGADDDGPTVDPERFQGPDERYPGGWRQFPGEWPTGPEAVALAGETRGVVEACLGRLPVRQRTVMVLRDVQGFDAAEVSELLGLTPGNQRVLLHRARAAVRRDLERYFADPPAGAERS